MSEKLGTNVKVSHLVRMLRVARYDFLIMNDSDIRVEQNCLRRLTFGPPWTLLALVLMRGAAWAWWLTAETAFLRIAMALVVGDRLLGDRHIWRLLPLIPLRDLVALCVWFASFASDRISWRGDYFHLKDESWRASQNEDPVPDVLQAPQIPAKHAPPVNVGKIKVAGW